MPAILAGMLFFARKLVWLVSVCGHLTGERVCRLAWTTGTRMEARTANLLLVSIKSAWLGVTSIARVLQELTNVPRKPARGQ